MPYLTVVKSTTLVIITVPLLSAPSTYIQYITIHCVLAEASDV